jgi:hypothetical protein
VLFAYTPLKTVIRLTINDSKSYQFDLLPLDRTIELSSIEASFWIALHTAWVEGNSSQIIDLITQQGLVEPRLEKKLIRLRKKSS